MKRIAFFCTMALLLASYSTTKATTMACSPTGFQGLTAALVNPGDLNGNFVDGTGCDIGVYYSAGADNVIRNTIITSAKRYGVVVNGDAGPAALDILDSDINRIGDAPHTGSQYGVAVYYRAFFAIGSATGRVADNQIYDYQKGGVTVNGPGANVQVQSNEITGIGPVAYIAQNGIQFGYGGTGSAMKNTVSDNQYTGSSTFSTGVVVVGGPFWELFFGPAPDGGTWQYSTNIQIMKNTLVNNDVGVALQNVDAGFLAPEDATNNKIVNNTISLDGVYNGIYQAAVSDIGNNDKIITNHISGPGYDPAQVPGMTFSVDADVSFTNRPKVHANR